MMQSKRKRRYAPFPLCLLPVYILSYRYKDKVYRFLMNGQTGKCDGDKPLSPMRIGLCAGAIVLAVALTIFIVWLLQNV